MNSKGSPSDNCAACRPLNTGLALVIQHASLRRPGDERGFAPIERLALAALVQGGLIGPSAPTTRRQLPGPFAKMMACESSA